MAASLEEFAYEISRAAIEEQERRLAEMRARTGTLLAAASIAGSFLAAEAARSDSLDFVAALAILSYVACVCASVYLLLPHNLIVEFRGSVLLEFARGDSEDL